MPISSMALGEHQIAYEVIHVRLTTGPVGSRRRAFPTRVPVMTTGLEWLEQGGIMQLKEIMTHKVELISPDASL